MSKFLIQVSTWTFATFFILGAMFAFCAIISFPFWLLWNWLMPDIFGLSEITWLQAFGLWILITLLRSSTSSLKNNKIFNINSKPNETDGTEQSPFGDLSWNSWLDQIKKRYEA